MRDPTAGPARLSLLILALFLAAAPRSLAEADVAGPQVRLLTGAALGAERALDVVAEAIDAEAARIVLRLDGVEVARGEGARLAARVALAWPPQPQQLEAVALDATGCARAAGVEFLRVAQRRGAVALVLLGEGCDETGPWAWVFARPPAGSQTARLLLIAGSETVGESATLPARFRLSGRELAQPFLLARLEASDGRTIEATLARGGTGLGESLEVRRALARRALPGRTPPRGARAVVAGVEQPVVAVESGRDLPLELGVALDESLSMLPLSREALALAAATGRELAADPGSREFVVRFDATAQVREVLVDRPLAPVAGGASRFGTTAIQDALLVALHEFEPGERRAAVVVVTDGCDTASRAGAEDVLAVARARGIPLYALLFDHERCADEKGDGVWGESRQRLARTAEASGGRVFRVAHRRDLSAIWRRILDELARQVVVVFEPSGPEVDPAAVELTFTW